MKTLFGCECVVCESQRAAIERGEVWATQAGFSFYQLLQACQNAMGREVELGLAMNNHGNHKCVLLAPWWQPLQELHVVGDGEPFGLVLMFVAVRWFVEDEPAAEAAMAAYRVAGAPAVAAMVRDRASRQA